MSTRYFSMMALAIAFAGCTSDTAGPGSGSGEFASGHPPETTLSSLSETDAIALCEDASAWLNDTTDLVRLAAVSQSLQGATDAAECESQLATYEEVSTDETGDVPVFSEGCMVVGARLATCSQSVATFEELFEWLAMDVDYQNSMLSCDLAGMPDVWQEIAWTDRTPAELLPLWECLLGR